jgi:hypothetical protein
MELTRSIFDEGKYDYLNKQDSQRYDELKDSCDPKDREIVKLILDKAKACRNEHCMSRY